MVRNAEMTNAERAREEEKAQYGGISEAELNDKYPNRPHNHSPTLPFFELVRLFNQLNENKKKPGQPAVARRKVGPNGPSHMTVNEQRANYIERFIAKWRVEVGNDIYPVLRLMLPEKDRDRAMYGLKEATLAKIFTRLMGLARGSEPANQLNNWKQPGREGSNTAGNFALRVHEILEPRAVIDKPGKMTIADVNVMLDKLSIASKEKDQERILGDAYTNMNPEEMKWLIRIMLRQMKVGATEKTILNLWHYDAENLFNISSSLRRVCWELYDPNVRLHSDSSQISLMQCFQPQLAAFPMASMKKIVERMRTTEEDNTFWVEEKLDGERMQMHMQQDDSVPGGFRFSFWSRKAKDYTYLYGDGFEDLNSSLTRHIRSAFKPSVKNIILDGEMITWNMVLDAMQGFGTLKTAAKMEQKNPYGGPVRPLFRVFDCLYLNDTPLTKYTLKDRRKALETAVTTVNRRLEVHIYNVATTEGEIEALLRKVVQESSEGLVVKNPRSKYTHDRTDDWIKVKPEYMLDFGEDLDCVVVGGYFGSGHRGGRLSSFLCALRHDDPVAAGLDPQKCWSFFKVGGGMSASDYETIAQRTAGKWKDWDPRNPPTKYIELGGNERQFERPDQWILPEDSVVLAVKAASVHGTVQFRTGFTLRFPRFKKLRDDKDWKQALSVREFHVLRRNVEQKQEERKFEMDTERKSKRPKVTRKRKRALQVVGDEGDEHVFAGPDTELFKGLTFFIMSGSSSPEKKSKGELEDLVKANGASLVQAHKGVEGVICISENRVLKAVSLQKEDKHNIIKPSWIFDCIEQSKIDVGKPRFLLPYEPSHMFHTLEADVDMIAANVDEHGDSYCRDLTIRSLKGIFDAMPEVRPSAAEFEGLKQLEEHGMNLDDLPGAMFHQVVVYMGEESDVGDIDRNFARMCVKFGGGVIVEDLDDVSITHVIPGPDLSAQDARQHISKRLRVPRVTTLQWILASWKERTMLNEEQFVAS